MLHAIVHENSDEFTQKYGMNKMAVDGNYRYIYHQVLQIHLRFCNALVVSSVPVLTLYNQLRACRKVSDYNAGPDKDGCRPDNIALLCGLP